MTTPRPRRERAAAPAFHSREEFSFVVAAPLRSAWPLFGADGERLWAPGWEPAFVWPARPHDQQGMVFKIAHGERTAVWVNTAFDRVANTIQYVYMIPEVVVTVISLRLSSQASSTQVNVIYERTALSGDAEKFVRNMAQADRSAGEEWSVQIARHLAGRRSIGE